MTLLCAYLLGGAGFIALYLAMPRHQPDALGQRLDERRTALLRWLGWLGLVLAWLACVTAMGWARGSVAIFGVLALAAAVIVLLGTRRARRLACIGMLALVGTAICMAAAWLG